MRVLLVALLAAISYAQTDCCAKAWTEEEKNFCTSDDFTPESVPTCGKCLFDAQCEGFQEAYEQREDTNMATGLVYCCPDAKRCLDRRVTDENPRGIGCPSDQEVAGCGYGGNCGPRMANDPTYPFNCVDNGCTNANFPATWLTDLSCESSTPETNDEQDQENPSAPQDEIEESEESGSSVEPESNEENLPGWEIMYEDLFSCANRGQTCIADCIVGAPENCVDMKTAFGNCASDCDDCVKKDLKRRLQCKEQTVQLDLKVSGVTEENFESMEESLIASFATPLGVSPEFLTLVLKEARLRRLLDDSTITVFIETDDAESLTEELNAQNRAEMMSAISTEMSVQGFDDVNVTDMEEAETFQLSTIVASPSQSNDSSDESGLSVGATIGIVVVSFGIFLMILGIVGFSRYQKKFAIKKQIEGETTI